MKILISKSTEFISEFKLFCLVCPYEKKDRTLKKKKNLVVTKEENQPISRIIIYNDELAGALN